MEARDYMSKGILALMRKSPFYSTLTVKQKIIESDTLDAPMATDGNSLIYNPKYILQMKNKEIVAILQHEAMHIANKHHIRMKQCRPKYEKKIEKLGVDYNKAFNIAADLAINCLLFKLDNTIYSQSNILKSGLMPGEGDFEDYPDFESAEFYLNQLMEDMNKMDKSRLKEFISDLDLDNNSDCSVLQCENDPSLEEIKTNQDISSASIISEGSNSSECRSAKKIIKENGSEPKLNWRSELDRFVKTNTNGRPNYRKPNRRYPDSDFILPTKKNKDVNEIIFLVDVSGSMCDEAVSSVYDHMNNMIKYGQNMQIKLLPFDDEVFYDSETIYNKGNLPIKKEDRERVSYGGTLYCEAMKYANEQKASGIIMLTDLMPCDMLQFEEQKITTPFLMLSVYAWMNKKYYDESFQDDMLKSIHDRFPNRRIIEVEV